VAIPRPISTTLSADQAPAVTLAPAGLRMGPRPRVPWIAGNTFHLRGHVITTAPYLSYDPTPSATAPYGTGVVVEVWDRNPLMIWYDAAGHRVRQVLYADGLTWSPTRHQVVWTDPRGEVVVASSATGRVLHRYTPPRHPSPSPAAAGWLSAGDLLFPVGYAAPRGWRTSSAEVTAEPASPAAVSASGNLVAGVLARTQQSELLCPAVWDAANPQPVLWDGCLSRDGFTYSSDDGSFSPDGRLLAMTARRDRGASHPFVAVVDARTGSIAARLDQGLDHGDFRGPAYGVSALRWEDDTHLLLVVSDRTHATIGRYGDLQPLEALVRCDVRSVTCELATTPRRTSDGETAAYGLVG
jgi:hypothetical protein